MTKTIKVIHLAPGESLLVLTDSRLEPVPPSGAVAVHPCPLFSAFQDDDDNKIITLVHVA